MQIARIAAAALFFIVAACGTSQTTGDGGTTPADGGGVCCPLVGSAPCGCAGGGGWAESADKCSTAGVCDAWMESSTDSHGCAILVENGSKCCGCPPIKDSGPEAASDAASDGATEASGDAATD